MNDTQFIPKDLLLHMDDECSLSNTKKNKEEKLFMYVGRGQFLITSDFFILHTYNFRASVCRLNDVFHLQ